MASLVGSRVERKEDKRFLTGKGRYTADVNITNQTYAVAAIADAASLCNCGKHAVRHLRISWKQSLDFAWADAKCMVSSSSI